MSIDVKIIADSVSPAGKRLTTMQIKFHRFVLPELNTHRVFSRNYSSSRAIPTSKLIAQVKNDPAMPVSWGKNQPGMQASELLTGINLESAIQMWKESAKLAASQAEIMATTGVHKQIINRLLEPYLWCHGIVSATEWDNFYALRCHPDAQPEIQELANLMRSAQQNSIPKLVHVGDWHLPYVTDEEKKTHSIDVCKKMSSARCCRVSYLKHDGQSPSVEDDIQLFDRLAGSVPIHASPLEHVAAPGNAYESYGNFFGWHQHRQCVEQSLYDTRPKTDLLCKDAY